MECPYKTKMPSSERTAFYFVLLPSPRLRGRGEASLLLGRRGEGYPYPSVYVFPGSMTMGCASVSLLTRFAHWLTSCIMGGKVA
jgi:hypothetical protein